MQNAKIVSWGLIISFAVCILGALNNADSYYALAGLGLWIFGIWAIIILMKNAPKA